MLDNLLTNKYFCAAVIIALILILYMYHTKQSCNIEGMSNVDLSPLAQELTEKPWAEQNNTSQYSLVGKNSFNDKADKYVEKKLKKNYKYIKPLKRSDQIYNSGQNKVISNNLANKKNRKPIPLDNHPELSQCQPCKCNNSDTDSDTTSDVYDSDSE